MTNIITHDKLSTCDLIIDALYQGDSQGKGYISEEPISKILRCGNRRGFRYSGSISDKLNYVVLFTTLRDINWPDTIDKHRGHFTYYGDNKQPGKLLHDKKGNKILMKIFEYLHTGKREYIPPIFIFLHGPTAHDVIFLGVAVPGAKGLSSMDDLVAVWKTHEEGRFQNYKATFTILDIPQVSREWINELYTGNTMGVASPGVWKTWVKKGIYHPLISENILIYRKRNEQLPVSADDLKILDAIISKFKDDPVKFERCSIELACLMDEKFRNAELTRPVRDGGRDAVGKYMIGIEETNTMVDYALEAKCYSINSAVGVKGTSRLISRLKHRQFGLLVTTSHVHEQAYKEIVEDGHPIIIISGGDIVNILKKKGYTTTDLVEKWIDTLFN